MLPSPMKNRVVLILSLTCTLFAFSCASRKAVRPAVKAPLAKKQAEVVTQKKAASACSETRKTDDVKEGDVDGDGRADTYKYYKEIDDPERKGERKVILVRQDVDLNWDGRLDICRFFDDKGKVDREELDLDYDGKTDEVKIFANGVIQTAQRDRNNDGRYDVTRRYKNGKLVQKETDTNDDGKPDRWEYYDGDRLDRIGTDADHDGKVDRWAKASR
jgi:hypothetical protein